MASLFKLTASRGDKAPDIVVAAGADLTGTDIAQLSFDTTAMTKGEALTLLENFQRKIHEMAWPPL